MKLSKEELIEMIRQEAQNLKNKMIEESKEVKGTKEPLKVSMNSNDKLGDSDKALVFKGKSKKTEKSGETPKETKMNVNANKLGSDESASAAVEVKAGAKKGGKDENAGKASASFTSKKGNQAVSSSAPFDDRVGEVDMNSEDKLVDEKVKTYISAGAAKSGKTHTAGQHNADVHEKIPKKDVEEKEDRIATGIEIDGSNIKIKESYTKSELKSFIISEANKAIKRARLEKELSVIKESLEEIGGTLED